MSGSLKTLVSSPAFVSASDGFSQTGPSRTWRADRSGSPGAVCEEAAVAARRTATNASSVCFKLSLPVPGIAAAADAQRPHLSIKVRALDAQRLRRITDSPLALVERRGDVSPLEPRARLPQRAAIREDHRPSIEAHLSQHVLQADAAPDAEGVDDVLEERPQLDGVAAPGESGNE